MNFYIAKLVFRIEVLNEPLKDQYEEKLIWIKAADLKQAYIKSIELAGKDEIEFINANHHHIRWKLAGITHLSQTGSLNDDMELFSEIKEAYTENETHILQRRAEDISKQFINYPNT